MLSFYGHMFQIYVHVPPRIQVAMSTQERFSDLKFGDKNCYLFFITAVLQSEMILQMLYINESCFTCTSIWPSLFLLPFLPLPITFFHTLAHLLDLGMNLPPNLQQVTTNTTFKNPFENPCFVLKMSSFWLTVDLSSASLQRQECLLDRHGTLWMANIIIRPSL